MQRQKNSCRNCRGNSPQRREVLEFEKLLRFFFPLSVFFFCLFPLLSVTDHISRLWSKFVLFSLFITILKAMSYLVVKGILISRISNAICSVSLQKWKERMDYVLLPWWWILEVEEDFREFRESLAKNFCRLNVYSSFIYKIILTIAYFFPVNISFNLIRTDPYETQLFNSKFYSHRSLSGYIWDEN